jgi:hypothetical protein
MGGTAHSGPSRGGPETAANLGVGRSANLSQAFRDKRPTPHRTPGPRCKEAESGDAPALKRGYAR